MLKQPQTLMPAPQYRALLLATALIYGNAQAGMKTLHYKVGNVAFAEDADKIQIQIEPPLVINVLPGGKAWPPLQLDESGRIFAGTAVIDPNTRNKIKETAANKLSNSVLLPNDLEVASSDTGYEFRQGDAHCTVPNKTLGAPKDRPPAEALREANVKLAASKEKVLALVTSFLSDGQTARYHVHSIEPRTCKVSAIASLGDPDLLVELGHTGQGGWWVTGSIEQTLLTSKDGRKWRKVRLPKGLSSLVSSYVVDNKRIWLAGILGDLDEHPNLLIYTGDGGAHWTSLKKNDPLLTKVPSGWLEGQKRKAHE